MFRIAQDGSLKPLERPRYRFGIFIAKYLLPKTILGRLDMLRNYLKIALRNMNRHKGYSFINMAGLAIGMACCILILLYVTDELSYDRFHTNS